MLSRRTHGKTLLTIGTVDITFLTLLANEEVQAKQNVMQNLQA